MPAIDTDVRSLQNRVTALEQGGGGGVTFAAVQTALAGATSAVSFNGQQITNADIGLDITFAEVQAALAAASGAVDFNGQAITNAVLPAPTFSQVQSALAAASGAVAFNAQALTGVSSVNGAPIGADGSDNTIVGVSALTSLGAGTGNSAYGKLSLSSCTSGNTNCAFGIGSLIALTTGQNNCVFGPLSGANVSIGDSNTILGGGAGTPLVDGDGNIVIGAGAGASMGGSTTEQLHIGQNTTIAADLSAGAPSVGVGFLPTWFADRADGRSFSVYAVDGGDERPLQALKSRANGIGSHDSASAFYVGDRDPNGLVSAPSGSIYFRNNDAASNVYVNQSVGSGTTWAPLL